MKCVIPSCNIKILAKALHSLSRIGEELFIYLPQPNSLSFRTINLAYSTYSTFTVNESFFASFNAESKVKGDNNCKISMKSCLTVFKTPSSMDKNIDKCSIEINSTCTKVIFQIYYAKGYVKTYNIPVIDNENIQINVSKSEMTNKLSIISRLLQGAIKHFHSPDEEITCFMEKDKITLKNFTENNDGNTKLVRTELCLHAGEFEEFSVNKFASLTISIKDIKAVLAFSESTNSVVDMLFERPGKPIIFTVSSDPMYEANYVVATMTNENDLQGAPVANPVINHAANSNSIISERSSQIGNGLPSDTEKNCLVDSISQNTCVNVAQDIRNSIYAKEFDNFDDVARTPDFNDVSDALLNSREEELSQTSFAAVGNKVQNLFQRCYERTFNPKDMIPDYNNVLVYDSDGMVDSE